MMMAQNFVLQDEKSYLDILLKLQFLQKKHLLNRIHTKISYQKYDQYIDQVSKEDIKRLANLYLDLNKAAIVTTKPKAKR